MGKWLSRRFHPVVNIVPNQDPLLGLVRQRIVRAEVSRDFELTPKVLGTGYSGAVHLAIQRATGQDVAVKHFSIRKMKAKQVTLLKNEVEVYLSVDHPNICRLLYAYEGRHDVWLVMELCGCELYSRLSQRKTYAERDAGDVMRQMLQAVNYLHCRRVVHRDLKLENWMYGTNDLDDRVKLIDFGFSRLLRSADETLDMPCGTLHYTSPEVLARKYSSQCDLWSLGVICYMLLVGRPPFRGANNLLLAKAIVRSEFVKEDRWDSLSGDARDFVTRLLCKDPKSRMDAGSALSHPWLSNLQSSILTAELNSDVLHNLRRFAQGSHLRRAALTVLAYSLTSRELKDLEETFLAFDTSGRGTITLDQLKEVMESQMQVSSQEVERIFDAFDVAKDDELRYTPFVAAMLATRVKLHEDKVRVAFEAFEGDHSGYITAEGLVRLFNAGIPGDGNVGIGGITVEEAEKWIREADYKGTGLVDYDDFLSALMGKELWMLPSLDDLETPTVRVFDDTCRLRSYSDPQLLRSVRTSPAIEGSSVSFLLAHMLVDGGVGQHSDRRAETFCGGGSIKPLSVNIRDVSYGIDENYFS